MTFSKLKRSDLEAVLSGVTGLGALDGLHDLADGSAGRALRLYQEGGLDVQTGLCQALSHADHGEHGVLAYSQKFTGKTANAHFSLFSEFFQTVLLDCTKRSRGVPAQANSSRNYQNLIEQMTSGRGLDCWASLWDKAIPLAFEAEIYNLNRQQTVLVMLDQVLDALKSGEKAF